MKRKFTVFDGGIVVGITLIWMFLFFNFLEPVKEIDPQLLHYYNDFNKIIQDNCKDKSKLNTYSRIIIKFVDNFGGIEGAYTIGQCKSELFGYTILIKKDYYEFYGLNDRYNLLFHELGHCILDLNHVENPKNFMYYEQNVLTYNELKSQVIAEVEKICE